MRLLLHFPPLWDVNSPFSPGWMGWNSYGTKLFTELSSQLTRKGYTFDLLLQNDFKVLQRALGQQTYHAVFSSSNPHTALEKEWLKKWRQERPWVSLFNLSKDSMANGVTLADHSAMELVLRHLVKCGYERLGWASLHQTQTRYQAWKSMMKHFSLPLHTSRIFQPSSLGTTPLNSDVLKRDLTHFIQKGIGREFEALVCDNDGTARWVLSKATSLGFTVPDDLGVTGVDGRSDGNPTQRLTTVLLSPKEVAAAAIELMEEMVGKKRKWQAQIAYLRPSLILGETTQVLKKAKANPLGSLNLKECFSLKDPASELAKKYELKRESFLKKYHHFVGKPFKQALLDVRMSEAEKYFSTTKHTVIQVAHLCGYTSMANFHRHYLKYWKKTPRQ